MLLLINISVNGSYVNIVSEIKRLGIVIDSRFEYNIHTDKMLARVMFQLNRAILPQFILVLPY